MVADSPLRDTVSGKILEYELDGILEELQRKWFETLGCMKEDILDPTSGGEDNTVTIAHVGGKKKPTRHMRRSVALESVSL